LTLLT